LTDFIVPSVPVQPVAVIWNKSFVTDIDILDADRVTTQSCSRRHCPACLQSVVLYHRITPSVTKMTAIITDVWLKPAGLMILRPSTLPGMLISVSIASDRHKHALRARQLIGQVYKCMNVK